MCPVWFYAFIVPFVAIAVGCWVLGSLVGWWWFGDGPLNWRILLGPAAYGRWLSGGSK